MNPNPSSIAPIVSICSHSYGELVVVQILAILVFSKKLKMWVFNFADFMICLSVFTNVSCDHTQSREMECRGCVDCIIELFTGVAPHITVHNR